jgi:hypothetical protein
MGEEMTNANILDVTMCDILLHAAGTDCEEGAVENILYTSWRCDRKQKLKTE